MHPNSSVNPMADMTNMLHNQSIQIPAPTSQEQIPQIQSTRHNFYHIPAEHETQQPQLNPQHSSSQFPHLMPVQYDANINLIASSSSNGLKLEQLQSEICDQSRRLTSFQEQPNEQQQREKDHLFSVFISNQKVKGKISPYIHIQIYICNCL